MAPKPLACCPACRLIQPNPGRACPACGPDKTTVLAKELVEVDQRRGLGRRTPTKRGWRWFDLLFVAAVIVGPLEAERHDPRWFVPALLAIFGAWVALRVVVHFTTRYRIISRAAAPRIRDVVLAANAKGEALEGVAKRRDQTTDAHLAKRRCLVSSLTLEAEGAPGHVRLRTLRAVPFVVEAETGERTTIEGEVLLVGEITAEGTAEEARAHLGGEALEPLWLEGASAREVLLQHNKRVRVTLGSPTIVRLR